MASDEQEHLPMAVEGDDGAALRARGSFSGESLRRYDPGKYQSIIQALAEGMGVRAIARAYHVSPNTVAAIRDGAGAPEIETLKEDLGRRAMLGAQLAIDRMVEEIDLMPRQSLPVVAGVLTDKALLLAGQATAITRVERSGPSMEDFNRYLESLPAAGSPETGGGAAGGDQKGAAAAPPALGEPREAVQIPGAGLEAERVAGGVQPPDLGA